MERGSFVQKILLKEIAEAERILLGHTQTVACYTAAIPKLNEDIRVLRLALKAVEEDNVTGTG
ncbi:hypothetical protein LCGC14_0634320 [marine sediment metagenome]|uniref:Uncharacterized protein n=1 Tax=marine sediment metagenome TaxID=412755 RepID=A0A0F9R114_9ZZZZ